MLQRDTVTVATLVTSTPTALTLLDFMSVHVWPASLGMVVVHVVTLMNAMMRKALTDVISMLAAKILSVHSLAHVMMDSLVMDWNVKISTSVKMIATSALIMPIAPIQSVIIFVNVGQVLKVMAKSVMTWTNVPKKKEIQSQGNSLNSTFAQSFLCDQTYHRPYARIHQARMFNGHPSPGETCSNDVKVSILK